MIIFVISVGVLCVLISLMLTLLIIWMREDDVNDELEKIYVLLNNIDEISKETLENQKDPK